MTLPAAQVSGKMVCAKPENKCPKVSSCNCCGNFTCFSTSLLYVAWEIQEKETKNNINNNKRPPKQMGNAHGKKNNHINLGEIPMERFWLNKWMVNEYFFWKDQLSSRFGATIFAAWKVRSDHLQENFYQRPKTLKPWFKEVASRKGGWNQPPKGVWVIFGMKLPSRTSLGN